MGGEDAAAILAAHNRYRAPALCATTRWSEAVAREARRWAARCDFSHSGNGLGENIAWGTAGAYRPEFFIKAWYDEVADYDYASGRSRAGVVGHFTQVVWAGTTEIGCGWARCGVREFLVCNYSPPGNYRGRRPGMSCRGAERFWPRRP